MVVFWEALSSLVSVARLIRNFFANCSCVIAPRRARKLLASRLAKSMAHM